MKCPKCDQERHVDSFFNKKDKTWKAFCLNCRRKAGLGEGWEKK